MTRRAARLLIVAFGLLCLWQITVVLSGVPPYILPAPYQVLIAIQEKWATLLTHAGTTLIEILCGLALGVLFGASSALIMTYFRPARRWLLPVLVISQSIPVFALAPILVLWLGYGLGSKIAMATLIIYFPVAATFHDGLRRTEPGWLNLAMTMNASPWAVLRHVRLPAALPTAASGIRVAAAVAPIGAVVGEWVGSSAGLGYLMLHANARMQTDVMFAALAVLSIMSVTIYFTLDYVLRRLTPWQADNDIHPHH